jgi:cell division protein FtsN
MTFPGSGNPFAASPVLVAALIGVVVVVIIVVIFAAYLIFHQDKSETKDPDKLKSQD